MKKTLTLLFSAACINCYAFNFFSNEVVVEAKFCSVQPCNLGRFTYSVKNNKIVQKFELLDEKRKVVNAEIRVLDDCKIVDDRNWNCYESFKPYGLMINVVNGVYYPQSAAKDTTWKQIK